MALIIYESNQFSCRNPHALDQKSLSFIRNVLSLVINPTLITSLEGGCGLKFKKYYYHNNHNQ